MAPEGRLSAAAASGRADWSGMQGELDRILAGGEDRAVEAVDYILAVGSRLQASDIHLEPAQERLRVRLRVEGELKEAASLPGPAAEALLNRLKVLGRLVTYRKRLPQDGRIRIRLAGSDMDLRLSFFPTIHGEKVVIRFLSSAQPLRRLDELGMSGATLASLQERLDKLQGAVLLTGPAGSGKTTTMYASLRHIDERRAGACNIMTVEDPVEHALDGVNQCQVQPAAGMGFAQALRSLLRQDPDVIMVGEIRDRETAEIAVQAGLTGHLVISTLHTPAAAGVFTRLVNLEIEPTMVASSVAAVLAQRLVRRVCPACAEEYRPERRLLERLAGFGLAKDAAFRKGRGCGRCRSTGFLGRTGIFELLLVDDDLRDLVLERAPSRKLAAELKAKGHRDLIQDGLDKVGAGLTTVEEIWRLL
ncbi:MAG: type II/IV secretion system protein [Elusimicrobia bacterium]|nr:type II/IV secretion system protein [Elusimicrobiota bacterium]